MDGFKGQPHQGLVGTVMAALSKRSRRSTHPVDLRRLAEEAIRVAAAVETEFSLIERPREPASPPAARSPSLSELMNDMRRG
ncbi:MAG TPA: hypothetical protein VL752_05445 [Acidisoma sp.]|uniref:hypothetical protein n=1 Tax=Acidisoma sp. TaxID=1872115 RepID=UPI002C84765C|nr:hypothetical protein [Acidisoma sp.]HTI00376.1 hypothetical protein [Acidisoma sp.]